MYVICTRVTMVSWGLSSTGRALASGTSTPGHVGSNPPPAANISAAVLARSALLDQLGALGVNSPVPHIQNL